jgi:integrase
MARPPLPAGTYGRIAVRQVGPSRYKARARYRGQDGLTRTVSKFGQTKGRAEAALKVALTERRQAEASLDPNTRIDALLDRWLAEVDASQRAAQTKAQYRYLVEGYIRRRMGELRIAEASTGRCEAVLLSVAAQHGPSVARSVRAVMNGVFRLAVRHGAIAVNPVRETLPISVPEALARGLTRDELDDFTDRLRSDKRAVALDLPDLVDMALATGCRIGELLALRNSAVDLERGTLLVAATSIRPRGEPLQIQEYAKSEAGNRLLALPSYAVELLRRRQTEDRFRAADLVFPSPTDRFGYPWVTFHTFRKTVFTMLDEAGLPPREISDQAGHKHISMTLDRYTGRQIRSDRAAEALDR